MALKFSEMIALRTNLARSIEAGFDKYLEEIAEGYGDYLTPVLADGETAPDVRLHLVLLRRWVKRHRLHIESLDDGVVEQTHDDQKVRAELYQRRDAVDSKLRLVRLTCRGVYGPESLGRIGLKGNFPRGPVRLQRFARVVKASLGNPDLGLEPLLDLGSKEGTSTPAQLAAQLDPELSELGELLTSRHQERRKAANVRSQRQREIQEFDHHIRGIVRMAQGMFRLAGRDDLGRRFRPILRRVIRKLKVKEADGAKPDPAPESADATQAAAAAVSEVTTG